MAKFNFNIYRDNYYVNMENIPYKLKGCDYKITIYPIKVKDYILYTWCSTLLSYSKDNINNKDIISMTYLEFLLKYVCRDNEENLNKLYWIFALCLHEKNISISNSNDKIFILDDNNHIVGIIKSSDFDTISKIILSYNDADYQDINVSNEVKKLAEDYVNIKYRDLYNPPFENKKALVCSRLGKTFSEIGEMPLREFTLIYNSIKNVDMYFGNKIIQGSYKYDVKDDIIYPLYEKPKSIFDEVLVDTSVLSNKGISGIESLDDIN